MGQYDKTYWDDEPISYGQKQALLATQHSIRKEKGLFNFQFQVPQGSWQEYTSYSGTSHTRANVVDLQYAGLYGYEGYSTRAEKQKYRLVLRHLKGVGRQAAFGRGPWDKESGGKPMILHFHVCDLNCLKSAETVREFQIPEFKRGNNGLNAGVKDRFEWRPDPIRAWRYKR